MTGLIERLQLIGKEDDCLLRGALIVTQRL